MSLPTKPKVTVINDRLAVFIGADYKLLPLPEADRFVRKLQSELARLRRQMKRRERGTLPLVIRTEWVTREQLLRLYPAVDGSTTTHA